MHALVTRAKPKGIKDFRLLEPVPRCYPKDLVRVGCGDLEQALRSPPACGNKKNSKGLCGKLSFIAAGFCVFDVPGDLFLNGLSPFSASVHFEEKREETVEMQEHQVLAVTVGLDRNTIAAHFLPPGRILVDPGD